MLIINIMAFGKVKELYKLQKEARSMKKQMKKLSIVGKSKKEDVVLKIDGTQEIVDMDIAEELLDPSKKDALIEKIKQAYTDAQKKLQKEMMKDVDMDKMKNMLGM